jgi:hypothetical protein
VNFVKRIEDQIVAGSEDFFDDPNIRKDLRATIGVAQDFYDFLGKFDNPPAGEVTYVSDTIRSGIDQFFSLAYICKVINTGRDTWAFEPHARWDFPALRERFLRGFEHLAESPDAGAAEKLALLFALTHLELVFLAQHFPSAIFRDVADGPQPADSSSKGWVGPKAGEHSP